jgi:U6 snRNA-associated Sm-like protein LSm7
MSDRANQQGGDKKKKETILDLAKYLDKKIRVKFSGGREASGVLKGSIFSTFFLLISELIA